MSSCSDPSRYASYAATVYPSVKIRENVGVSVTLAAGIQGATESPAFQFGGNATAETTIGIYQPWALKISAGGDTQSTFDERRVPADSELRQPSS